VFLIFVSLKAFFTVFELAILIAVLRWINFSLEKKLKLTSPVQLV